MPDAGLESGADAGTGAVAERVPGEPPPGAAPAGPPRVWGRAVRRARRPPLVLLLLGGLGALLFVLPLLGLLAKAPWGRLGTELTSEAARTALGLSLLCSLGATAVCVLLGVPLAWIIVRVEFPGRRLLRALATLPVVLPPVVGGVALLLVFGRRGLVGGFLYEMFGIQLAFTTPAVILAEAFVAMPFLVLTVSGALQSANRRLEDAARTLGAGRWTVFWRVTLPLIRPSLLAGTVLCWARALGEFGATITFAGNVPGSTQTLPLAVYLALETNPEGAYALSLVLLAVSVAILIALRRQWLAGL